MKEISQRKYSRYYKHILKIISAIIVPLLLATFTVVITFEQRKENDQQRFEDRELARIHREQDLNTSILTREADKLAAQLQRENDREIADNQRNMSQILENYRYEQERIKYLDNLLANYLNEIGQLLKENNGS
jgi:regulator of protease activity HflC (stomatin/prohibitin superfamily)